MKPDQPSWWDPHSDQPYKLPKGEKPRATSAQVYEYLKTALTALVVSPAVAWRYAFPGPKNYPEAIDFVGLGISPDHGDVNQLQDLVGELGVQHLLLRVPSWHYEQVDYYLRFAERFPHNSFLINILQSRDSVEHPQEWRRALGVITDAFLPITKEFQIGNAINRTKWGCRHTGEYLSLLEATNSIRKSHPGIVLAGSSVIDFEPLATLRTLINFHPFQLDACASAMYVNRRGSPRSKQYGLFSLREKLRLIFAITKLSRRSRGELWITETNWPLLNTKPYTPNSGLPRSTVDEGTQAQYLTDYYRIAHALGYVSRVYWWQLVNPGYGLIDHRDGQMRKMPSFFSFKHLLADQAL
jgi:hypothetical protein